MDKVEDYKTLTPSKILSLDLAEASYSVLHRSSTDTGYILLILSGLYYGDKARTNREKGTPEERKQYGREFNDESIIKYIYESDSGILVAEDQYGNRCPASMLEAVE